MGKEGRWRGRGNNTERKRREKRGKMKRERKRREKIGEITLKGKEGRREGK